MKKGDILITKVGLEKAVEIFKNKVLSKLANLNSDLLKKEDWWFSKGAFESSFREFLTANGITTKTTNNASTTTDTGTDMAIIFFFFF